MKPATIQRKLYFSEEFGGTNGPIQFYITVDGQKQKVFEPNEKPVITTKVGAIEDWTIENRALETHAFHIHQIHFRVLEIDGRPVGQQDLLDTIAIPYWDGKGPFHSVKLRMDFRDPDDRGHIRVSLPHPAARGSRHDAQDSGRAVVYVPAVAMAFVIKKGQRLHAQTDSVGFGIAFLLIADIWPEPTPRKALKLRPPIRRGA